jgi:GxxExxY protein
MKYAKLTHEIIGAAMKVHSTLGNGFQEVIYQRALVLELNKLGLKFEREKVMPIYYHDEKIGTRRVDFFIEDKILLELKAMTKLEEVHLVQAINYCEAYGMPLGLIINFGAQSLEYRRVYNQKHPENRSYRKNKANMIHNKQILKS